MRRTGRAAEYDLLRAQVEVTRVESDSVDVRNEIRVAKLELKDVIGLNLDRQVEIAAEFRETSQLNLEDLPALLQLGRSEEHTSELQSQA